MQRNIYALKIKVRNLTGNAKLRVQVTYEDDHRNIRNFHLALGEETDTTLLGVPKNSVILDEEAIGGRITSIKVQSFNQGIGMLSKTRNTITNRMKEIYKEEDRQQAEDNEVKAQNLAISKERLKVSYVRQLDDVPEDKVDPVRLNWEVIDGNNPGFIELYKLLRQGKRLEEKKADKYPIRKNHNSIESLAEGAYMLGLPLTGENELDFRQMYQAYMTYEPMLRLATGDSAEVLAKKAAFLKHLQNLLRKLNELADRKPELAENPDNDINKMRGKVFDVERDLNRQNAQNEELEIIRPAIRGDGQLRDSGNMSDADHIPENYEIARNIAEAMGTSFADDSDNEFEFDEEPLGYAECWLMDRELTNVPEIRKLKQLIPPVKAFIEPLISKFVEFLKQKEYTGDYARDDVFGALLHITSNEYLVLPAESLRKMTEKRFKELKELNILNEYNQTVGADDQIDQDKLRGMVDDSLAIILNETDSFWEYVGEKYKGSGDSKPMPQDIKRSVNPEWKILGLEEGTKFLRSNLKELMENRKEDVEDPGYWEHDNWLPGRDENDLRYKKWWDHLVRDSVNVITGRNIN